MLDIDFSTMIKCKIYLIVILHATICIIYYIAMELKSTSFIMLLDLTVFTLSGSGCHLDQHMIGYMLDDLWPFTRPSLLTWSHTFRPSMVSRSTQNPRSLGAERRFISSSPPPIGVDNPDIISQTIARGISANSSDKRSPARGTSQTLDQGWRVEDVEGGGADSPQ